MTRWMTEVYQTNGINIHYLRTGGKKRPIVLLHGLMTSSACWTPLARTLEEDYDIIMPDARGHGNSSAPDQGYSYDHLATDVLNLIEALHLDSAVLLGHSMGGMIAAVAASRNPKWLKGLILTDPTFLTLKWQQEVYESDVLAKHLHILNRPKEEFLGEIRMRQSHRSPEIVELLAEARLQTSIHAFEILKPPNPDYIELIKALHIPSLLIIGGVNSVVSPVMATELAKLNPYLKIAEIPEAGHGIPYDQPEHFSTTVKAFLRSLIT